MRYVMIVDGMPGNYCGAFPDLPGCTLGGDTIDEVLARAPEVVAFHLEGLAEDGEPAPVATALETLRADPRFTEDFADAVIVTAVDAEPPTRTVRVNITLDETVLARIDRAAENEGKTRSAFLVAAARERIAKRG